MIFEVGTIANLSQRRAAYLSGMGPAERFFPRRVWPYTDQFVRSHYAILRFGRNGAIIGYALWIAKDDLKHVPYETNSGWGGTRCAIVDKADGLVGIVIRNQYRRRGYGKRLMRFLLVHVAKSGLARRIAFDGYHTPWVGEMAHDAGLRISRIPWTR